MGALCILISGKMTVIATTVFSLTWTHSAQKTIWQEEWLVEPAGLTLTEARLKGSGAGMEPPEDAKLIDGWFVYSPDLPAQRSVMLAASGMTGGGWQLCAQGQCLNLGETVSKPIRLSHCEEEPEPSLR